MNDDVKKKGGAAKVTFSLRVSKKLRDDMQEEADKERRSLAFMVSLAMDEFLQRRGKRGRK